MKYNKCKRCELNYITGGETYCQICKREMNGKYTDTDADIEENICPYCEKNRLEYGEDMCAYCKSKKKAKDGI